MSMPLRITYHGLEGSESIEHAIRERAEKLPQFYDRIQDCRVVVEVPHRSHRKGNQFQVKVDLVVPGEELVVTKDVQAGHPHEEVSVLIRDAFDAVERQLEAYAARQSGGARRHAALR
jgi:ribosome-associated translation inhibitor RaiA